MKKIFLFLLVFLIAISFVLGDQVNDDGQQVIGTGLDTIQAGQGTGDETQNQGTNTFLENQEKVMVKSGNYVNSNGEQMQIQTENGFRLKVGNVEAQSSLVITQEQNQEQNRIRLKTQLSNGDDMEIKVMPNTAAEKAIERLQLKNCNSENSCSIQLKEVGNGEQVKAAYEVQAQKEARFLGMFKTKLRVQAQINAETGEVIKTKKSWWAFLASE